MQDPDHSCLPKLLWHQRWPSAIMNSVALDRLSRVPRVPRTESGSLQHSDSRADVELKMFRGSARCWGSAEAARQAQLAWVWPRARRQYHQAWMTGAERTPRV